MRGKRSAWECVMAVIINELLLGDKIHLRDRTDVKERGYVNGQIRHVVVLELC